MHLLTQWSFTECHLDARHMSLLTFIAEHLEGACLPNPGKFREQLSPCL